MNRALLLRDPNGKSRVMLFESEKGTFLPVNEKDGKIHRPAPRRQVISLDGGPGLGG